MLLAITANYEYWQGVEAKKVHEQQHNTNEDQKDQKKRGDSENEQLCHDNPKDDAQDMPTSDAVDGTDSEVPEGTESIGTESIGLPVLHRQPVLHGELVGQKQSGRSRQRAAKWWAGVRRRTPSPTP